MKQKSSLTLYISIILLVIAVFQLYVMHGADMFSIYGLSDDSFSYTYDAYTEQCSLGDIPIISGPAVYNEDLCGKLSNNIVSPEKGDYCWTIPLSIGDCDYNIPYGDTVKIDKCFEDEDYINDNLEVTAISSTHMKKDGTYYFDTVGDQEYTRYNNLFTFRFTNTEFLEAKINDLRALTIQDDKQMKVVVDNNLVPGDGGLYVHRVDKILRKEYFSFNDFHFDFGSNEYSSIDVDSSILGDVDFEVIPYIYFRCGSTEKRVFDSRMDVHQYRVLPVLPDNGGTTLPEDGEIELIDTTEEPFVGKYYTAMGYDSKLPFIIIGIAIMLFLWWWLK